VSRVPGNKICTSAFCCVVEYPVIFVRHGTNAWVRGNEISALTDSFKNSISIFNGDLQVRSEQNVFIFSKDFFAVNQR
jgi:hypothetical protein